MLYGRVDEKTGRPRGLKPDIQRYLRLGGLDASSSACWRVYTLLCAIVSSVSISAFFALAFFGFGVPLLLAIAFGVTMLLSMGPQYLILRQIVNSGYMYLYIDEEFEESATPSCKNAVPYVVIPTFIHLVFMGVFFWFGVVPLMEGAGAGALRTVCLTVSITVCFSLLQPQGFAVTLFLHAWMERLPKGREILVDSYAHSLIATIMDTGPEDAKARLKRIDVLFRNFMNEFQSSFGQIEPTRAFVRQSQ